MQHGDNRRFITTFPENYDRATLLLHFQNFGKGPFWIEAWLRGTCEIPMPPTRCTERLSAPGLRQPIVLTLYGPEGQVAVPLLPKRALTLAQELLTRGVQAIKVDWPG